MIESDKKRFMELMIGLAEDCSSTISDAGLKLRFNAMKEYTIEQIEPAVVSLVKTNVYPKMPTTGAIIREISGNKEDDAEIQLTLILKALKTIGYGEEPQFKDPVTKMLIEDRYGWYNICQLETREIESFSRNFKAAYVAHVRKKVTAPMQIDIDPATKDRYVLTIPKD